MTLPKHTITLSWITTALIAIIAAAGLFWPGDLAGPGTITSVYGETVQLYGRGLYAHDALLTGAGFRGTDVITLVLVLPLLIGAISGGRRGAPRATLILLGALSYALYYTASLSLAAAHNPLFLLYIAGLAASLFALVTVFRAVEAQDITRVIADGMPRRALSVFMWAAGVILFFVWTSDQVAALITGEPPTALAHYTTYVTHTLDLGIIVPLLFIAGRALGKDRALGYLLASPLLTLCTLIGIVVLAQTAFQLSAGVPLTPAEIAVFAVSFMIMALVSGWLLVRYLRHIRPLTTSDVPVRSAA